MMPASAGGYGPDLLSHSLATFGGTLSPSMICVTGGGHDKDGNFGGGAESCTICVTMHDLCNGLWSKLNMLELMVFLTLPMLPTCDCKQMSCSDFQKAEACTFLLSFQHWTVTFVELLPSFM